MKRSNKITVRLVLALVMTPVVACNSTGFKGSNRVVMKEPLPSSKEYTLVAMGMDETVQGGEVQMATIDRLKFVFQAGDKRIVGTDTSTVRQAVDLYFALDTTASMTDEMNAVKNGITGLVSELRRSGLDLQVGLVGFVDSFASVDARTYRLSNNYTGFRNFVSNIRPTGNDDYPEAAIYAARRAVQLLRSGSRQGALKAVVLITDVVGHNGSQEAGGNPVRDCSVLALANEINAYAATLPRPDDFKFFYTVPDPARVTFNNDNYGAFLNCESKEDASGYTAVRQTEDVMGKILPAVAQAQRGGALRDGAGNVAWPLTENNLVTTLVPMLQDNPVTRNVLGSCLASSAEIFENGERLARWDGGGTSAALKSLDGGDNTLNIADAIPRDGRQGVREMEMLVDRCCISAEDLRAGKTSSCRTTYRQTIPFKVEVTAPKA